VRALGTPIRLASSRARIERAGPLLGEHTREVLAEAGCDADETGRLISSGAAQESVAGARS